MHAADAFVPLDVWLRGPLAAEPAPAPEPVPASVPPPLPAPAETAAATAEAFRDLRLFRARLADALDLATVTLARELAAAVLGRELRLAPSDLAALATRILADHPAATPLEVRHAPGEVVDIGWPAVADAALAPGDLVVVFREGTVDARLGVRLDAVLEAWA